MVPPGEMSGRWVGMNWGAAAGGGIVGKSPVDVGTWTPLVNTRFMSSPEHCNTSMYLFLLPMNMNFLCLFAAAASADCSLSICMNASPEGVP